MEKLIVRRFDELLRNRSFKENPSVLSTVKTQHLPDAVTRNPEMQCRRSRTHAVSTGQTDFPVKFHGENTPALPGVRKGKSGRLLRRPQPDHPAATVDEFCTAVLKIRAAIPGCCYPSPSSGAQVSHARTIAAADPGPPAFSNEPVDTNPCELGLQCRRRPFDPS